MFTDETMPASAELIDVDADGDNGVVAWMDGTTMKVSTQTPNQKVIATNCVDMFSSKTNLSIIDFSNLNTSQASSMGSMFFNCYNLTTINNLLDINTENITNMAYMFANCWNLSNLDLSSFRTNKVTTMIGMFYNCKKINQLDLSTFDTRQTITMEEMFSTYSNLNVLKIGINFVFVGSDYRLPEGTWYASDGTAYTSDGKTCTIPNNKADTYTRK